MDAVDITLLPYAEVGLPPASLQTVDRVLQEGIILKIGRQVIKDGQVQTKTNAHGLDIWYASKVISRTHAELWAKEGQVRHSFICGGVLILYALITSQNGYII